MCPNSLFVLSLDDIDFSDNAISGTLPSEIGLLKQLSACSPQTTVLGDLFVDL